MIIKHDLAGVTVRCFDLLGKYKNVTMHFPGGCSIGARPIDQHIKGFELLGGGSNRLTRCHVWGGPIPPKNPGEIPEMLVDSINYVLSSYDAILTDCYADTGKTGFLITENARLIGCSYFNNYTYKMDDVTVIDHKAGQLLVNNCMFRKDSPNATLYKGNKDNVIWDNNMLTGGMEF